MKKNQNNHRCSLRALTMLLFMLMTLGISAQNINVKGSVSDKTGEPVIGASVKVKGTNTGAITNVDGNYSINCSGNSTLEFSYLGYETQKVAVNGKTTINVTMSEGNAENLNEVVVTAMGIKKDAKKLGYSVATVGAEDLVRTAAPNFASAMYGKAAGVRIQSAPGGNTSAVSISVRGLSSITGNTQPLIVLDGVPIHNGNANNSDYWSSQRIESNGLVDINTEDIDNISILKGAAASALYGSEAANGVIMITTKKGKAGSGTHVDFNASVSMDNVAYMPEIQKDFGPGYDNWALGSMTSDEALTGFLNVFSDRNGNKITTPRPTIYTWGKAYDASKSVTYFDGTTRSYTPIDHNQWADIFRTGWDQNYNVSVTNATDKNNIRFSYTYNSNESMQYNSNNDKHNFNLSGKFNVFDAVDVDYTVSYMRQHVKNRAYRISRLTNNYSGMFGGFTDVELLRKTTVTSLGYMNTTYGNQSLTPDETWLYSPMGSGSLVSEYFWNILGRSQTENNNRFISSVSPTWKILPYLKLRGRIATDLTIQEQENKNSADTPHIYSSNGQYSDSYALRNYRYEIYYGDLMLMFDKTFNDVHNVTAYVGWTGRQERLYESSVSTSNGLSQENWFNLAASVGTKGASMDKQSLLKTAIFATASYGYGSWAYLEGTIRQEKTSTLAKGNNSFWYPSVSTSFIYTELFKDKLPSWYNYGKLRLSYGIVGNAPEIYSATQAYQQGTVTNGSVYTYNYVSSSLGNESIKPEKKHEFEIGLESRFFGNRLGFELSYYSNDIKDQILKTTAAYSQGGGSLLMNVGELTNKGLEFSVYGTPVQTKDWIWDLRANIAWNQNKVKKLADGLTSLNHLTVDNGAATLESHVGEPMGDWYAYDVVRDADGNKVVDSEGLYKVDYSKRVKVGNAMPKLVGGFSTSLTYKSFTLDATIDYRIGGDVLNLPYQYMMDAGNIKESLPGRDAAHGGIAYYCDNNNFDNPANRHIAPDGYKAGDKYNGCIIYDNGVIQKGVKEDGSVNDIIVTAFERNDSQYGWGYSGNISYSDAIQKNSYVKLRELSLSYLLPKSITKKFGCNRLSVSAYGRNLFYFYRSLKMFDSEASDGTNWIYQAQLGGSTAAARTFGISLRASF